MTTPSTDNYNLGKGVVYFDQLDTDGATYKGERDLGNASTFTISIDIEKLEHYSSRGGLKAKDKEVISQMTPACAFTLEEIVAENIALLTLGAISTVSQVGGSTEDTVTARLGNRVALSNRALVTWLLPYNDSAADNVLFVVGETVTGAGGAEGVVAAVSGTAASGTLTIIRTNTTDFVDGETLTGGTAGLADVNSATGGSINTSTPTVVVKDEAGTTTYVAGTDFSVDASLKDHTIGRVKFLEGGSITDGDTVKVTYQYGTTSYTKIEAFSNTEVIGRLRFVSDNPVGNDQELEIWSVSLTPSGDTAFIGDDWSTLAFSGEILKDEENHADNPYMSIIMNAATPTV